VLYFPAKDGIRDFHVTGVQTCALPILAPEGPAIALPTGRTQRVRAHAQAHAELEDAGEGAGAGQAGDQGLQDADLRRDLHDAHHVVRAEGREVVEIAVSSGTSGTIGGT